MKTKMPSYSDIPTSNTAATLYGLMRGVVPIGVTAPFGATNVMLQDVCAADPSEHGVILGDPVAYALALDALTHRGPARPSRLPATTCQETFIPHGDAAGSYVFLQGVARFATGLTDPRRWVDSEPRVPAYARPWVE